MIEDGDQTAAEVTFAGTNDGPLETPEGDLPPTGRPASVEMFVLLERSPDGLVVESRGYYDVATVMAQLGLTPRPQRTAARRLRAPTTPTSHHNATAQLRRKDDAP